MQLIKIIWGGNDSINDLGVLFGSNLSFKDHISHAENK